MHTIDSNDEDDSSVICLSDVFSNNDEEQQSDHDNLELLEGVSLCSDPFFKEGNGISFKNYSAKSK